MTLHWRGTVDGAAPYTENGLIDLRDALPAEGNFLAHFTLRALSPGSGAVVAMLQWRDAAGTGNASPTVTLELSAETSSSIVVPFYKAAKDDQNPLSELKIIMERSGEGGSWTIDLDAHP